MDINKLVTLINLYRESSPLVGLTILDKIEKMMPEDAHVIKQGNCQSFRDTVSFLLFN